MWRDNKKFVGKMLVNGLNKFFIPNLIERVHTYPQARQNPLPKYVLLKEYFGYPHIHNTNISNNFYI